MSKVSETIFCQNPHCVDYTKRYGNKVYERKDSNWVPSGYIAKCERCGGNLKEDGTWEYNCVKCKKNVPMGELHGLFVPHLCLECHNAETEDHIRRGSICGMCRQPRNLCCC